MNLNIPMKNHSTRRTAVVWTMGVMIALMMLGTLSEAFAHHKVLFYPSLAVHNDRLYGQQDQAGALLVPKPALGGERYFLVPIFIYNETDATHNPNVSLNRKDTGQRMEPIR